MKDGNAESFIGEFYQKSKILNSNNFFEKSSSNYRFLVISKNEKQAIQVKEIEIYFYSYTNKFLEDVSRLFPEKAPAKFTIYEKTKYGEAKLGDQPKELEVVYTNFTIRQAQSSELLGGLERFATRKTEAQQLFHEKTTYSLTPDEGLWKLEETQIKEGEEQIRWKNYPTGSGTLRYPYTEFYPNKNTLEYSRIYSFEDFSYKKIFKDIPSGSKLYSNKDYVIYYYPGEMNEHKEQTHEKNKQLTLYKANLPLLIYKKKESTIE